MKLEYNPTGMPPCFNLYQLEEVLGVSIPYVKQIMFMQGVDYWYDYAGLLCFDSDQTYKRVILRPAKEIFGNYLYSKLTNKRDKYTIMGDIEEKLKEIQEGGEV